MYKSGKVYNEPTLIPSESHITPTDLPHIVSGIIFKHNQDIL